MHLKYNVGHEGRGQGERERGERERGGGGGGCTAEPRSKDSHVRQNSFIGDLKSAYNYRL